MVKKFGLVATLLAAVCCGWLLAGCADGDGEDNYSDYDYEEKKKLDYWNNQDKADAFEWIEITNDNRDKIVGTWKSIIEFTNEMEMVQADEIGYSASMEFVIDDSFKCEFTFISDSSRCNSKKWYKSAETEESEDGGATEVFPKEFVDGEGYKYVLKYDDKKCIATATAKNLTLEQLTKVLHCDGFSISTTENRLLLKNRPNDGKYLYATWQFTASTDDESDRYGTSYVIARADIGDGDGEDNDSDHDYEEKKSLDYWNKWYKPDNFEWEDITDANRDKIVGTWKAVYEQTSDNCEATDVIGYYTSMEFVIDNSFKNCKFTFITDSSKCKSKEYNKNINERFSKEFVNGEDYEYNFNDKNYIATATAENLNLKQLAEVLRCEGFSISEKGNRLLLRNRSDDTQDHPATWIFSAADGTIGYVIAKVE